MKFLFVAILIALAIQLAASQGTSTTTEAATTTAASATTTAASATTTAASATTTARTGTKRCWRGNNWCHTRRPNRKCKNPARCIKTVVIVTRRRG